MQGNMLWCNIYEVESLKEKKEKRGLKIHVQRHNKKFPKFCENSNLQIHKPKLTTNWITTKKTTPRYITVTLLKIKHKDKTLEVGPRW